MYTGRYCNVCEDDPSTKNIRVTSDFRFFLFEKWNIAVLSIAPHYLEHVSKLYHHAQFTFSIVRVSKKTAKCLPCLAGQLTKSQHYSFHTHIFNANEKHYQ